MKRVATIISPPKDIKGPMSAQKQRRNDLCRCGSGKKAKKCHGTEAKYRVMVPKKNAEEQFEKYVKTNTQLYGTIPPRGRWAKIRQFIRHQAKRLFSFFSQLIPKK